MSTEDTQAPEAAGTGPEGDSTPIGLRAVIESNVISQEHLPMLEVICDRMVRLFTTSLRNMTSGNVDVEFDRLVSVRFGEFLRQSDGHAVLGVFTVEELENFGLITFDRQLARDIIDTLLGYRHTGSFSEDAAREHRPFTQLETNLVGQVMSAALDNLAEAFAEVRSVTIKLDRIETGIHFATITGMSNVAVVAEFNLGLGGRSGQVCVLLPYTTIEPVRERLSQRFMGEQRNLQSAWEEHLQNEVRNMELVVKAVLGEQEMELDYVRKLELGQVIPFGVVANSPVLLQCGDIILTQGLVGQHEGKLAVSLSRPVG
jgi:flagellar motor switch protein FliM